MPFCVKDLTVVIANGARIYYLNRSQPPLLTEMVKIYHEKTNDETFLKQALPVLDKEHAFWMAKTSVRITRSGKRYRLNRYNVESHSPRPESYVEDYDTAYLDTGFNATQAERLFSDLATGAETGWDYSSRWTRQKYSHDTSHSYDILRTLETRNVVPVDLNAILWGMESTLAQWHAQYDTHDSEKRSRYYRHRSQHRLEAIEDLLWNEEHGAFYDFNLTGHKQNIEYTPASLYPFW